MAIRPISDLRGPPLVTALPTVTEATEIFLEVDTAGTYGGPHVWHCFYRPATAGAYKWHVISGDALINVQTTIPTPITSTTYVNISTLPAITLPFGGDWDITCFCKECWYNGTSGYGRASYTVGATAATDFDGPVQYYSGTGTTNGLGESTVTRRKTGLAAGTAITMQAKVSGGTFYPNNQTAGQPYGLWAKPLRIG